MKIDTRLIEAGRDPEQQRGAVNPPIYRASTVVFPTLEEFETAQRNRHDTFYYGRYGTPTTHNLETAITRLEGSGRALITGSGLGAITTALLTYLDAGDHLLMADNVYAPTRGCAKRLLARFGIETTFFDPMADDITPLLRSNTRVLYLEAPGSLTFEVPDVPRLASQARAAGLVSMLDNTWATPYLFRPREHGIDVSILSATKYINGNADLMMGAVTASEPDFDRLRTTANFLGNTPGPDECYSALRGLRSLAVRLRRHEASALELASWLANRPEVERVLHPSMPRHPGHAAWARDFDGSSGLFGVVLKPCRRESVAAMINRRRLFGIGASWGGYESLMTLEAPERHRTVTSWSAARPTIRIHAGLEDPADLIADLEDGFARLNAMENGS